MARNSGGTYSLPSGNPVGTGTSISSTVHNNTMNDIKTELTDSLSRSNKGAMLAQLQLFDGTESVPGLAWGTDSDTGFYRIGAGNIGFSIDGVKVLDIADDSLAVVGAAPLFWMIETDAAVDEKRWLFSNVAGDFYLSAYNDAIDALSNPLIITRTGTVINSITFAGTQINLNCTAAAVNGALGVSGNLTIGSSKLTVDATNGNTGVVGDLAVNTDKFTVAAATGNTVVAGTLTVNSLPLTPTQGSFTMELATASSGGSVLASGTAYWKKTGNNVTLRIPYLQATTTDNTLYLRGIPAEIQPALTGTYIQSFVTMGYVNGNVGLVYVLVAEGVDYWEIYGISAQWDTNSNAKGIGSSTNSAPTISYHMAD